MGFDLPDNHHIALKMIFNACYTDDITSLTPVEFELLSLRIDNAVEVFFKNILPYIRKEDNANELDRKDEGMGRC